LLNTVEHYVTREPNHWVYWNKRQYGHFIGCGLLIISAFDAQDRPIKMP
jgi:hypothetical protein